MFNKKTIQDIEIEGKKVLVRVDFNVPLQNGEVSDDTRIKAALPTIEYLLGQGAAVILCSHLGRPKTGPEEKYSLRPVALYLSRLIGKTILFSEDCVGPIAKKASEDLKPGDILLLENTRFHAGEEKNDPAMAASLASLADVYVNDAFGSAHRAHVSTEGVTHFLPSVAGFLLEKEIRYLGKTVSDPAQPFVAILGGAKISDKIGVIKNLLNKCDAILIGGGMANTFLKAKGYSMGNSLVQDEAVSTARELLANCHGKIHLPIDVVIGNKFEEFADIQTIQSGNVPEGWLIMDIGPKTVKEYSKHIAKAATIVWNGPMGVFEFSNFAKGTFGIAKSVAGSNAVSIIGGGESVAAIQQSGLAGKITHISTGGGASLEMLEGIVLPGVAALMER